MRKINYFKFALDLLMGVTFVLLFNKRVIAGLTFHEIAGVVIGVAFITHILLNASWVKNVTLKIFNRKLPAKTRFSYLLNLLLLMMMTFIIISGIFISRVLFPNITIGNERWFQMTHISVSFLTLILVGVHVGLHWKWVMNVWNRMLAVKNTKPWVGVLLKVIAATLFLFGAYQINQTGFLSRAASTFTSFSQSSPPGFEGRQSEAAFPKGPGIEKNHSFGAPPAGDFNQGEKRGFDRPGGENIGSVLSTYLGIMSVFIIITYYLGKFRFKRKMTD
ncbi:DUF4405 domain-containing protein [Bacillota bacterium Lsc_1132]